MSTAVATRTCADDKCAKPLADDLPRQQKYCDPTCRRRKLERETYRRKRDAVQRVEKGPGVSARGGPGYDAFVKTPWPERILSGEATQAEAVLALGETKANVNRWMVHHRDVLAAARVQAGWTRQPEIERMLADDGFAEFRARFFKDERGNPYQTPAVHLKWIAAILAAILGGRRQLVLSPPRHGKTALLIHFAIWLICRNPNIRIMWVGGNELIAKNAVGAVLDELENNLELVEAVLGPASTFKPATRTGKTWSSTAMTVATRTGTGIKSPTLVAVGKGGKLLSRDADLIVVDDIVDNDSVESPAQREKDFTWLNTQLASRKEEHTAILVIGSRQHHQDLYSRLISNPAWAAVVEHAHDPLCELPTHAFRSPDEHDGCTVCSAHVDCMLFPAVRSFAWLQDQRASFDDDLLWEMVYQNITRPDGADPVTLEHLRHCRNSSRRIGEFPPGCVLIAGHDPASAGMQGNVLWAVDPVTFKRTLVDLEEQKGGGTPGFRKIMREWDERYHCKLWVVETQNNNDALQQDRDVTEYTFKNGITILSTFTTMHTKWSPDFGVPVQLALFRRREMGPDGEYVPAPLIDLPYGDEASREKIRRYEQQVMNFEPGAKNNGDLLLAGWFPETEIRNWRLEHTTTVTADYDAVAYPFAAGDDGYASLSEMYEVA